MKVNPVFKRLLIIWLSIFFVSLAITALYFLITDNFFGERKDDAALLYKGLYKLVGYITVCILAVFSLTIFFNVKPSVRYSRTSRFASFFFPYLMYLTYVILSRFFVHEDSLKNILSYFLFSLPWLLPFAVLLIAGYVHFKKYLKNKKA
ncbi:hypothetical protein ACQ33O_08495 [Ferruginibacter sp. SUN002]|uniref:hypothetical protein n=1 Tax=Ferruginibacter sp. SUN002 TaxID=2937789 RepID=UPI003D3649FF